jgi:ADP-ribose pyrophosphatase YjhB (NUDIX family)
MTLSISPAYSTLKQKRETENDMDSRDIIRREMQAIHAVDDLEKKHIKDTLVWIDSGADLFRVKKPDVPLKHLVSYFVLVDPKQKSLLLVDHILAQLWLPTGGHVEIDEHPKDTVIREAKEELSLKASFLNQGKPFFITVTETVGLTPGHTDVSLWYLLKGNMHDFVTYDKREFNDIEWFTFKEILESDQSIFDPHMHRFTKKLAADLF